MYRVYDKRSNGTLLASKDIFECLQFVREKLVEVLDDDKAFDELFESIEVEEVIVND